MPGIFISYRRADSPDATGRIYDRLVAEFGRAKVFKDIDSIPLGRDFRTHLNEIVADCAAVLAIVGPHWSVMSDEAGNRRLEDPDDFVRIELEAALARNIPVVPVLVGHALMPVSAQLPASLAPLAYRQSIEVRPDPDFHHDATRLVTALRQIIDPTAPAMSDADAITRAAVMSPERPARRVPWMAALAAASLAGMIAMLLPMLRHLRESPPPEMRFDILTPATADLTPFALSPDGRQIVFAASGDGETRLWLRSLASTTAQPLAGTEGAVSPFWSPDSRSIAFFAGNALKRLDLGGGAPQLVTASVSDRGGSWNEEGVILFAQGSDSAILRVPAGGGKAQAVTTLGPKQTSHRWPWFLPDGNHFLYLARGAPEVSGIYLGALDGSAPVRVTASLKSGVYLPSGWLLWERGGALLAQKLNLESATLIGSPLTLVSGVDTSISRSAVSVASTGMIAYRSDAGSRSRLIWFDRSGTEYGIFSGAESGNFGQPRLSPDGRRLIAAGPGGYWLLDGTRASRFTFDQYTLGAVWSRDGSQIAWKGWGDFNWKPASGAGTTGHLPFAGGDGVRLLDWTADRSLLLFCIIDAATASDLWVAQTSGASRPTVFLKTRFNESGGVISPDGHWLAYHSNESGRAEVYVRPFVPPGLEASSGADQSRWQVSTAGGVFPVWRRDGRELYYISPAGALMAAPITVRGSVFEAGAPLELFRTRISGGGIDVQGLRQYDVAPDGRFLINTLPEDTASASITVIQNWNPGK